MKLKTLYSSREVASMTGLTARQLQWWDEARVFQPSIAPRKTEQGGFTERRYSPVDVLELFALAELRRRGFDNATLKQMMEAALQDARKSVQAPGLTVRTGSYSVQPRYNLLFREIERELLPLCSEENIAVIPYNPLAGGFLTTVPNYRRHGGSRAVVAGRSQAGQDGFGHQVGAAAGRADVAGRASAHSRGRRRRNESDASSSGARASWLRRVARRRW